ncbi:hypothetical protein [Trueperella sp. LYQ143]|uniref:hypothetical protein n=1 Tax=unclassified Trueperella TaxID=2630174 RepID=UPI003983A198
MNNTEDIGDTEQDIEPRFDLHHEVVTPWQHSEIIDDHHVRIFFAVGSPRCFGARTILEETESAIRIAVVCGLIPDSPSACTLELLYVSALVHTQMPIGNRPILPLEHPYGLHTDEEAARDGNLK